MMMSGVALRPQLDGPTRKASEALFRSRASAGGSLPRSFLHLFLAIGGGAWGGGGGGVGAEQGHGGQVCLGVWGGGGVQKPIGESRVAPGPASNNMLASSYHLRPSLFSRALHKVNSTVTHSFSKTQRKALRYALWRRGGGGRAEELRAADSLFQKAWLNMLASSYHLRPSLFSRALHKVNSTVTHSFSKTQRKALRYALYPNTHFGRAGGPAE